MDNFNIIYKILKELEKAIDYDEFDMERISAERLKISENRLYKILEKLKNEGYINGINVKYGVQGDCIISVNNPKITLKGLEYLNENGLMKKAANFAKGIKETIPGL